MCGLVGACWFDPAAAITQQQLERMSTAIQHRGPDGAGHYVRSDSTGGVALGHRRLAIIDPQGGDQPVANEDESIWVVFNGEIYNDPELRQQLLTRGHTYRSHCDTETLVHLYEEFGLDMVQHLRGMFAFAIWDAPRRRIFLARDRLGQKPLVYRVEPQRLLFASELKALLQFPNLPRTLNPAALDLYLTLQYVPHPHSILQGFAKLPPGHVAVWEDNHFRVFPYWQPPFAQAPAVGTGTRRSPPTSYESAVAEVRTRIEDAVRVRLRSDVPLGAFLSGGIDSTIITAVMQQQLDRPVQTFSIGFGESDYDETQFARMAAKRIGTDHHEQIVAPAALEMLPRLVWQYEEPFADSSAIPTLALCEVTRRHVTVALSGDGGDELFAGYDRYQAVRMADQIDRASWPFRRLATLPLADWLPDSVRQKSLLRRAKRFQASLRLSPRMRYLQWISHFQQQQRAELYTSDWAAQLGQTAAEWFETLYDQVQLADFVLQTTGVDQLSYLPCDILTKVDIASMAHSLECRSPFLDHHVVELAASLPRSFKMHGRIGKRILRDAFGALIPAEILNRKKMGFGVPVGEWFRGPLEPLLRDYVLSERALGRGYFQPETVRRYIDEHTAGHKDHAYRLWSLLVLEVWHRIYLDEATVPGAAPSAL